MSSVFVGGIGAVSPAGWGMAGLREILKLGEPLPVQPLARPGWNMPLVARTVPAIANRLPVLAHSRLRRTSPISQYAVAAGLEALADAQGAAVEELDRESDLERLGIVLCVMAGCVKYTRRFYSETLKDPATASPLVFPETVFNAPASHLAAVVGATGLNYTLVGDPGTFLVGLALAAQWLGDGLVGSCLVIGAEELDWLTADATRLFSRQTVVSEGAGALYLTREPGEGPRIVLEAITDSHLFTRFCPRGMAARCMRQQLPGFCPTHFMVDSCAGDAGFDGDEREAWTDWNGARVSPKKILGDGLAAASAWQCAVAVDALRQQAFTAANVSVVGCNQQAIGAHFRVEPQSGPGK